MDYREELLRNVTTELSKNFSGEQINEIRNILIIYLDPYELSERCTEVALRDSSSEKLKKLFFGSLLTEGKSKNTVQNYNDILRMFMRDLEKPLIEATYWDIMSWLANLQNRVSKTTCENYRSVLSSFYNWLTTEEFIQKNPMAKIKPIKHPEFEEEPFSDLEVDLLRNVCTNPRIRATFEFILASGVRASELCDLNRDDINYIDMTVKVNHGKGDKARTVFINKMALYYLQEYLKTRTDNDPALFYTRNKTRLSTHALREDWHKIGNAVGIKNCHPHRGRKYCATILLKRGVNLRSIQMILGHASLDVTQRYLRLSKEKIQLEYKNVYN